MTPIALRISAQGPHSRRAVDVRTWLEQLELHHGVRCEALAEQCAHAELARGRASHAQAQARRAARDQALALKLPSTAQQLVQAGLFDSRALRQSTARHRTATLLSDESDERAIEHRVESVLSVRVTLVAVRFGRRGAG